MWLSATVGLTVWEWLRSALLEFKIDGRPVLTGRYAVAVSTAALGLISFLVAALLSQPAPDIVYKAF